MMGQAGALPRTQALETAASGPPMVDVRRAIFVVRACGERTERAMIGLLRSQIADLAAEVPGAREIDRVQVVRERPFVEAVRATMRIGADAAGESEAEWVIALDADVLIARRAVRTLLEMAGAARPETFVVTGLVLCRFFGGMCFRGVHVYRRSLMREAESLVGAGVDLGGLKPESAVCHAMQERGHPFEGHPRVIGVHDYEQWLRHVYLKVRMRARREMDAAGGGDINAFRAGIAARAREDPESRVALWGIDDGVRDAATGAFGAGYDWCAEWPEFADRMRSQGLKERPTMDVHGAAGYAARVLAAHDYAADMRTPAWIRERLEFAHGWSAVRGHIEAESQDGAHSPTA